MDVARALAQTAEFCTAVHVMREIAAAQLLTGLQRELEVAQFLAAAAPNRKRKVDRLSLLTQGTAETVRKGTLVLARFSLEPNCLYGAKVVGFQAGKPGQEGRIALVQCKYEKGVDGFYYKIPIRDLFLYPEANILRQFRLEPYVYGGRPGEPAQEVRGFRIKLT
jgi:hypothetical protein